MLKVSDMTRAEIDALLESARYGHLAVARDGHPYVVPMNYAFDGRDLYFLTTEGTKTEYIGANREVCFQVEEVDDATRWRSVMLTGRAERLTAPDETERAMRLLAERNPTLAPAINSTKIGPWTRLSHLAIFRVRAEALYGRKTV